MIMCNGIKQHIGKGIDVCTGATTDVKRGHACTRVHTTRIEQHAQLDLLHIHMLEIRPDMDLYMQIKRHLGSPGLALGGGEGFRAIVEKTSDDRASAGHRQTEPTRPTARHYSSATDTKGCNSKSSVQNNSGKRAYIQTNCICSMSVPPVEHAPASTTSRFPMMAAAMDPKNINLLSVPSCVRATGVACNNPSYHYPYPYP